MSRRSRHARSICAVLLLLLAVGGCAPAPSSLEAAIGEREHPRILARFGGPLRAPELERHVATVGRRVLSAHGEGAPPLRYQLLDAHAPNAFSLPGGRIYVTRGLLALLNDDAELAAVLAHEIAHLEADHALERLKSARRLAGEAWPPEAADGAPPAHVPDAPEASRDPAAAVYMQRFSRQQEFEADRLAVDYLEAAGYDPRALARVLRTLAAYRGLPAAAPVSVASASTTHPALAERIAAVEAAARSRAGAAPRADLLGRLDGLLVGPDPADGLRFSTTFVHPRLGLQFALPPAFSVVHADDWLLARTDDGLLLVFDTPVAPAAGTSPPVRARHRHMETDEIAGAPAAILTATARRAGGAHHRWRFVKPGGFDAADRGHIDTIIDGIAVLGEAHMAAFPRRRLAVVEVERGARVADLAERMEVIDAGEPLFRLLNGIAPDAETLSTRHVKIIRRERVPQTTSRASKPSSS